MRKQLNKPFVKIVGEKWERETIGILHYGYLKINIDWKKRIVTMQEEKRKSILQSVYEWILDKFRVNGGVIMADKKSDVIYRIKNDTLYRVGHPDWKAGKTNLKEKSYEN